MVPNGWEVKKLGDLCNLNPKKPLKPNDGIVSFIAMHQLSESGKVLSTEDRFYDDVSKGFTSFKNKDVLVAKITPCFENGKGAMVNNLTNGIGFGSTEFHVLRSKKGTCPEFIYYLTRTTELRVKGEMNMQGSAGHRRVTTDYFNAYKVLTPPFLEQQKIAKILSTWDKAIATTERLVATSQQQKKALMQQLLTGKKRLVNPETGMVFEGDWEEVKTSQCGSVVSGGTPSTDTPSYWNGNIHWVTPTDITKLSTRTITQTARTITEQGLKDSSAKLVPAGSLLVCTRATIGEMAISRHEMCTNQGFKNLIPNKKTNIDFLYYLMSYEKHKLVSKASGSTFLELSKKDFEHLRFIVPKVKEQQKIASVLIAADKEIEQLEAKLAHLKEEKKALMQQLLTGKRRVKIDDTKAA